MPYSNNDFQEPQPHQKLWRYMSLPKFLSMIQKNSLFFPSLSQYEQSDPWEGLVSKNAFNYSREIKVHNLDNSKTQIHKLGEFFGEAFESYVESEKESLLRLKKIMHVNCWHINDSESDSQWKIYGENEFSLAIVTDFESLKSSIVDERKIYGSNIEYYDPNNKIVSEGNVFNPAIHKRMAFSHEKEFRLIFMNSDFFHTPDLAPSGLEISMNLKTLIQKVVISPRAPAWFQESILKLMNVYNLDLVCEKSDLLKHPFS